MKSQKKICDFTKTSLFLQERLHHRQVYEGKHDLKFDNMLQISGIKWNFNEILKLSEQRLPIYKGPLPRIATPDRVSPTQRCAVHPRKIKDSLFRVVFEPGR